MVRRIAITQRIVDSTSYHDPRDALSQDWTVFLSEEFPGAAVLPIPNLLPDLTAWMTEVIPDLVVLSNGNDWGGCPSRDALEVAILEFAKAHELPVLCVCRGFQVLAASYGVELSTRLREETGTAHVAVTHSVALSGPAFIGLAGETDIRVNSYHNQGVRASALPKSSNLVPFATSPDGVLEGMHHRTRPILGIQWHPERPGGNRAFDSALITELVTKGAFWT